MPETEEARRARMRQYMTQYMAESRRWRMERHRCTECGKKDAYTLGGRQRCYDCTKKQKERDQVYYAEHVDEISDAQKKKREQRRIAGLCTACGGVRPAGYYPYRLCPVCRAKAKAASEKYHRKQGLTPRSVYESLGMCYRCGRPVADGVTACGDPLRLCDACYEKIKETARKAREARQEKHGKKCGQIVKEAE